ncbi:concanavalin A-like lectin/glucanase domain-containing protein [Mariannaea sp. PMI_226]|nr:concanavalin A-like lectin/glucanase domain-containing protein [Mariannaea sp. PMI_226]
MLSRYLVAAAALTGLAVAQTTTSCNPLNTTDCPVDPALGTSHFWNFNSTPSGDLWETIVGYVPFDPEVGATLSVKKQGDSPTLRTTFYFFFGRTELWLKASSGVGIVSSMMWLSDDLDEVDWELLGANNSYATTNYYGKGREDFTKGEYHYMKDGMQDDYHNYTTVWTADKIEWWADGNKVRTLLPNDANSTQNYPQTPMRLSIGIWAAGDPSMPEGTREWAGGDTDYSKGPFNMYVKSVQVDDYSTGKEYKYGDMSGTWKSIDITEGNSTALVAINKKPAESTSEKFNKLPVAAKTAIYAGGVGVAAIGLGALAFMYIRARRAGSAERKLADERAITERHDLMGYKGGEDSANQGHEYNNSSGGWQKIKGTE